MAPSPASCRLYAILARDGRSAVVFRRGPSRQVLVLRWWLSSDTIEAGQWLKGRIYERRCDLSPNGDLLIYFAAKWETTLSTWTAISRMPYLTALALWPKGDAWGGGGVFENSSTIGLNHLAITAPVLFGSGARTWHPLGGDNVLPAPYKAVRWSEYAGRGEDNPLHAHRITRDGWVCKQEGVAGRHGETKGFAWVLAEPEIFERRQPLRKSSDSDLLLRRALNGIGQQDGPWYFEDHTICAADGKVLRHFSECSWADWGTNGDLLLAQGSCLYRLPKDFAADKAVYALENAKLVADLGPMTFAPKPPPDWAKCWP